MTLRNILTSTLLLCLALPACAAEPRMVADAPPEVAPGPGAPRVHVRVAPGASEGVELREMLGYKDVPLVIMSDLGTGTGVKSIPVGRPVCAAPCSRVVDGRTDHEFYFGGDGLGASRRFKLTEESGDVFFTVQPRRQSLYVAGEVLAVVGAGALGLGTSIVAIVAATDGYRNNPPSGGSLAPFVMLGAGSALLGTGIALLLAGRTTYAESRMPPTLALSW